MALEKKVTLGRMPSFSFYFIWVVVNILKILPLLVATQF